MNLDNYFFGYIPNPEGTAKFCDSLTKIGHEPNGKILADRLFDDEKKTVVHPQYLKMAFPDWKSYNQEIGSCVGFSSTHCTDEIMAIQIFFNNLPEQAMYLCSVESLYGFMRVELFGKPDYSSGGSYGAAAAKAIMKFGSLHRKKYNIGKGYDLTTYSGDRCYQWGRTGVPDELEEIAREHLVQTTTQIKDFDTAAKFIMNGYPIINTHGRNPTFVGERDSEGFSTKRGTTGYAHAMNYVGVRFGSRPGLLKVNSGWPQTVTGPMGEYDFSIVSDCAWWEDADTCNSVFNGDDSFAYSQYNGFKKQKLDDYGTSTFL
jgi:hypothetical protein